MKPSEILREIECAARKQNGCDEGHYPNECSFYCYPDPKNHAWLIARVKRLTEALEWYAEPCLWGKHPLIPGHKSVLLSVHIDAKDGGDSARKALEEV